MSSLNPSWRLRVLSQELWGPVFSLGFRLSVDIAGQGEGLLAAFTSESLAWMVIQRRKGKGKGRVSRGMRVPCRAQCWVSARRPQMPRWDLGKGLLLFWK